MECCSVFVQMFHCCFSSFCTSLSTRFVLLLASDSRLMQTLIRIPTHYTTLLRSKQETVELQETCTKAKVFNLLLQHLGPVATSTCMPLYLCPPLQRVCVYVSIRPSSMSLWRCPPLQRVCLYVSVRPSNVYVSVRHSNVYVSMSLSAPPVRMFLSALPVYMSLCLCPPLQRVCLYGAIRPSTVYVSVRPSNVYVSMFLSAPPTCMSLWVFPPLPFWSQAELPAGTGNFRLWKSVCVCVCGGGGVACVG